MRKFRGKMLVASILTSAFFLGSFGSLRPVYADGATVSQFHFRMGYLNTGFSGVLTGSFSNINAFDLEYEILTSSHASFTLRTTLVYDISNARVLYSYTGIGRRFYLFSNGMAYDFSDSSTGDQVVSNPQWRTYVGGDFGLSQVVVKSFGTVLQTQSALVEFGPNVGGIFQLSKSFGLELQLGLSLGLGFSSVSVSAVTVRSLIGGTYYF
ncbi:MAG: hypothetical protein ABIQ95_07185 [Bdellovibrionia bacterium]